jgi:mono/diheme cytochrome c family protein
MTNDKNFYGLLAEFEDPTALCKGAERVRDAGYKNWDCHTPFPVHGLDDCMGVKFTRLPWIVLTMGLIGLATGVLLQWWTNSVDYAYDISGKPVWSLPANIPVVFEVTVLFSAFTAFFAMWGINGLPRWYHPLFRKNSFAKATDDGFFLAIEAKDPNFALGRTSDFLNTIGAKQIEEVREADEPTGLPGNIKAKLWITAGVMLIPIGMVYQSWDSTTTQPRVHLVKDMDKQDRFRAQGETSFFEDGRMSRSQIEGTVAEGQFFEDASFVSGKDGDNYITTIPAALTVDEKFLADGKKGFDVHCGLCHGDTGAGDGMIHQRASELAAQGEAIWVQPTDLNGVRIMDMADGQIFETISNGLNTMPAYAGQIPVEQRWQIIAYVRALQAEYGVAGPSAEELAAMTPAQRGESVYTQMACVACHVSSGTPTIGPSFQGLMGSSITLTTGESITVDLAYLTESLRDPMAKTNKVVPIPGMVMTPFAQLTDEQIADLFEYLSTLK